MICFSKCDQCARQSKYKGYRCDAFPEGIPYPYTGDPERKNCSGNGFGYKEDEKLAKIYRL